MRIVRRFLKRFVPPEINALLQAGYSIQALQSNIAALRRESLLASERVRDPKRLLCCGFKAYSQNDEDGILQEIFRRIGVADKTFIEFGVGLGTENNSLYLLQSGWRGLWIEANHEAVVSIRKGLSAYIEIGQLTLLEAFVDRYNIDSLIGGAGFHGEIDLLSIDIDGSDYWIWKSISAVMPRVLCIEYNATFRPPISVVVDYRQDTRWNGTNYAGVSLKALEELGSEKGYALVGCCLAGINAFFVRKDLVQGQFCAPFTAENHFEPARYSLFLPQGDAQPPGLGVYKCIDHGTPKD